MSGRMEPFAMPTVVLAMPIVVNVARHTIKIHK